MSTSPAPPPAGEGAAEERAPEETRRAADDTHVGRGLLWVVVSLLLVVGVPALLMTLRDPGAVERWVITFADLLRAEGFADALRERGMRRISARLTAGTVAIIAGVGGVWGVFVSANAALDRLVSDRWRERLRPLLFVGPGLAMVSAFLILPSVGTVISSLTDDGGAVSNYTHALTAPNMRIAWRNNLLWLVLAPTGSVLIGLLFAGMVDRVKREALAKTFVFLPLAISFVGASVIWRFVYWWRPPTDPQIGLVNAVITNFGFDPIPFIQTAPLNTIAFIVIMIWLQTGFAMVVLSAAIKGVPSEVIEAARIDGAGEIQIFVRVIVPMISSTILMVTTTICFAVLKVFDIIWVLTGGRQGTEVAATAMFREMFRLRNFGQASAISVVLLILVIPIMVLNVRNLRRQGIEQ